MPSSLPKIAWDRGYIAALTPTGSETRCKTKGDVPASPCIPSWKQREKPVRYHNGRDKRRNPYRDNRIESVFGRLKDWPPATTDAQRRSSRLARWLRPSYTGFEPQRVLTLSR